ncbi:MAG: type II toxin-antitoxin system RelE/ParE family toxin [Desulfobaccales bacterium]
MMQGCRTVFYRTTAGIEPVKDWLEENGWPKDVPLDRSLGGGLWQVSGHLRGGEVARIFFCRLPGLIVLLHACISKIPLDDQDKDIDIELARRRMREIDPRQYLH